MKPTLVSVMTVLLLLFTHITVASEPPPLEVEAIGEFPVATAAPDSLDQLVRDMKAAVKARNQAALKSLMSSRFDWALDGYVSRDEAFGYIGSIGWNKFWLATKKALAKKPEPCPNPASMNTHSGYCVDAFSPTPVQLLFEQLSDGHWYWTAFPGD